MFLMNFSIQKARVLYDMRQIFDYWTTPTCTENKQLTGNWLAFFSNLEKGKYLKLANLVGIYLIKVNNGYTRRLFKVNKNDTKTTSLTLNKEIPAGKFWGVYLPFFVVLAPAFKGTVMQIEKSTDKWKINVTAWNGSLGTQKRKCSMN